MAQPAQVKFSLPNNDFAVIDNVSAAAFPSLSAGTHIGYDTPVVANVPSGAVAQGLNSFGGQGTVLLDISGNDTVYANPQVGTVAGNPVSLTQPTYKTVTKVIQNSFSGIQIAWKNPA